MSHWLDDIVFKSCTQAHNPFWQGLTPITSALYWPENPWRTLYCNSLATWEAAVKRTLVAEATWLEQWSQQLAHESDLPEAVAHWARHWEEFMHYWLRTQLKLWDECFGTLKIIGSAPAPAELNAKAPASARR